MFITKAYLVPIFHVCLSRNNCANVKFVSMNLPDEIKDSPHKGCLFIAGFLFLSKKKLKQ